MKLPFFGKREPVTLRERLLAAVEQAERAEKVLLFRWAKAFTST